MLSVLLMILPYFLLLPVRKLLFQYLTKIYQKSSIDQGKQALEVTFSRKTLFTLAMQRETYAYTKAPWLSAR